MNIDLIEPNYILILYFLNNLNIFIYFRTLKLYFIFLITKSTLLQNIQEKKCLLGNKKPKRDQLCIVHACLHAHTCLVSSASTE